MRWNPPGPAVGGIVDGCPPGLALTEAGLQLDLDRRRPGKSRHTTQRREPDQVQILSRVSEGLTTGAPIGLIIHNQDQRSKDYSEIAAKFRPGHADYTYTMKYGLRDYRGGGRSSARETAIRVAAGSIAKKYLGEITPDGFLSNNAGGVLGGISSGQSIVVRIALKPTSSLRLPGQTVDIDEREPTVVTTGRHDPCVGIRATPIAEAMLAIVIMDHLLRHRGQNAGVHAPMPVIPPDAGESIVQRSTSIKSGGRVVRAHASKGRSS